MCPKLLFILFFPIIVIAQFPQKINFQILLQNTNVEVIANKSVSNKISILSDSIINVLQNQEKLLQNLTNIKDIDGNTYNTIQIGSQFWMSENLKSSRYRNGGLIPNVVDETEWEALKTGARSWYNNDAKTYDYPYGNLYNWYTTLGDTLCPTGWRVPSLSDLKVLTDYLGGECVAEGKMKSNGIAYWNDPNTGATNESGFSALPGGFRGFDGSFNNIRESTYIWSTTEFSSIYAWYSALYFDDSNLCRNDFCGKSIGASVRCIKNL